jgi:hypothetical protein
MEKVSKKLLTVFEAEARTGRKASSWRRDILLRRVSYVKIGRSVRIPAEAVDALIAKGWRDPISPIGKSLCGTDAMEMRQKGQASDFVSKKS